MLYLYQFYWNNWAATWQNQQSDCAPSEDSDQPGHPPSLISLRCPREECLGPWLPSERTAKTLIRLGGCPGWSESSLGAHSFCWLCHVAAHMSLISSIISNTSLEAFTGFRSWHWGLYFGFKSFTPRQDYFTHFEPSQLLSLAKTGDLREKTPDHPQAELAYLTCDPS